MENRLEIEIGYVEVNETVHTFIRVLQLEAQSHTNLVDESMVRKNFEVLTFKVDFSSWDSDCRRGFISDSGIGKRCLTTQLQALVIYHVIEIFGSNLF